MKANTFKFIFLLLLSNYNMFSQPVITINELQNLTSTINKLYDDDKNQIDNVVKNYIAKGFILTTFSDSL